MLELKHISFAVPGETAEKEIIRDINLTVGKGKFVVITGPNGGGKSTLAKLIAGIEKPTSGTIELDGVDMTEKSITERAHMGVSYAFQQPVKFKGICVIDLLRIASGKKLSVGDACAYLSEVGLCDTEAVDEDTITITRYMNGGVDAFGHATDCTEREVITVCRR